MEKKQNKRRANKTREDDKIFAGCRCTGGEWPNDLWVGLADGNTVRFVSRRHFDDVSLPFKRDVNLKKEKNRQTWNSLEGIKDKIKNLEMMVSDNFPSQDSAT